MSFDSTTRVHVTDPAFMNALLGRRIVAIDDEATTLILDNGVRMEFEVDISDCCSSVVLKSLATDENVITNVEVADNEDETGGEGAYRAWIHVITEAGELNIAEAEGDASNGYYLHGFALAVTITTPHLIQEHP